MFLENLISTWTHFSIIKNYSFIHPYGYLNFQKSPYIETIIFELFMGGVILLL